jgi:hypothetical protein
MANVYLDMLHLFVFPQIDVNAQAEEECEVFNAAHIPCNRQNIQNLIQQFAQSVINNHLSFMMSLLHVSASTRPSSGRLCTKEYRYSKFCRRCACVKLKYNIIN